MAQALADGLYAASLICLMTLGLLPLWLTRRVFHFAHGAVFVAAPYSMLACVDRFGPPGFVPGVFLALFLSIALGIAIEWLVYRPLTRRRAGTLMYFIASLGVYTMGVHLVALIYGDESRTVRYWSVQESVRVIGGVHVSPVQMTIMGAALLMAAILWIVLRCSHLGKTIRAVSDSPELSLIVGIDVRKVRLLAAALGSALIGAAGVLTACDVDMTPQMGMRPVMIGLVAAIVGDRHVGVALGAALILGLSKHVGAMWFPAAWQETVVFATMMAALSLKRFGALGATR